LVPRSDCTVYWYVVDPVRPVSSQVVVGALTVHTVAVEGDVRRTVYWPGVGPDDGADQEICTVVLLVALAPTDVGTPRLTPVDVPLPPPPGAHAAEAAVAPNATKVANRRTSTRLTTTLPRGVDVGPRGGRHHWRARRRRRAS
jgi:hypothetical protein